MRTASDPLRASRKRIAELRNLGNVISWIQSSTAFHARDVDAVIALDPGRRTKLAQEI
jgi:hypothetical protein